MIEFNNISLEFDGKKIFNQFNLEIETGEKILLNAPSGKGKSTLVKILLGFIKPNSGFVKFDNTIMSKKDLSKIRQQIGYVSQDVDLPNKIVENLIEEIFEYKSNKAQKPSSQFIHELFLEFNLPCELLKKNITQLSGGERQRLGFILCILLDRPVWILDEITSGLDSLMKEKIIDYVIAQNKTVIIISHDKIWKNYDVTVKEW